MSNSEDIRRIFRGVPGLFLLLKPDPGFTIIGASDDYLRATHTDSSIFGRPVFEVFPDNPAQPDANGTHNIQASLERVLATRQPDAMALQRYDVRLPPEQGGGFQERYWLSVNTPVITDQGEVEFIVQKVEEAVTKANRDAIDILESIAEGFFTLDRHWRFDYVNREAHRILGVEPGSLAGRVLWETYPGLEGTDFERNYQQTMYEREKTSFTAFYDHEDRWYEVTTFPAPEGVSVYFRDVTREKKLQAEREMLVAASDQQRRIYETALDSTPDFVYVFDVDHRALYANAALLKTWGVDDVRGKRWMDLGYEQWHADLHDREIEQVISTRAPIRGEIPFTGTNGRRVYDYIFAPVLGPDGDVVAVAGTTRDITDRQAAEQAVREQAKRLAEADRAKDEFLATLSHELRNPLAPLRNAVELLRRAGSTDDISLRARAVMERQIAHLIRLVDDLLEVSRISRGVFSLRKERVDVSIVVRNAVETSEPLIAAAGHSLTVDLPRDPLWLNGDPTRLTQVLANLLNNASAYTDKAGRIVLRAWREGHSVAISVTDNGIGIAAEELPRLFEMFTRGNRERARNQVGLGIGLALSRRLAEMHEGTLDAHSEGIGTGSKFTLRLPLPEQAEVPANSIASEAASLGPLRVLVIDDNRDAADSLAILLSTMGAEVQVAYSGPEGVAAFAAMRPCVVLLDIGMPGMNGYDVARAIRSGFPHETTTLVALTGWSQKEDRDRARDAGFDHHMAKPAEIQNLQALLGSLAAAAEGR